MAPAEAVPRLSARGGGDSGQMADVPKSRRSIRRLPPRQARFSPAEAVHPAQGGRPGGRCTRCSCPRRQWRGGHVQKEW